MNEEYLWNKQGEDAEIERLENALAVFRYKETAPPAVSAKVAELEKPVTRRWFPFAFAFAGAATALIVCAFVFSFDFSNNEAGTAKVSAEFSVPEAPVKKSVQTEFENVFEKKEISPAEKNTKPKAVRIVQARAPAKISDKSSVQKTLAKVPEVKLTDKEKYAYGQLMLALSITNSKLNIVRDKMKTLDNITVSKSER